MRGIDLERAVKFGRVVVLSTALLGLASCLHRGPSTKAAAPVTPAAPKPVATAAPAPPPPPLSIPQTHVELPAPQPLDPAALETESAPPDAQQPALRPAAGPPRRPAAPPAAAPVTPPAATAEPVEAPIREVIAPAELDKLREQAKVRREEVDRIFAQLGKRGLARSPKSVVDSIKSFLALSKEAESRNDLRQADALAERAQILARDLLNGK